MTKCLLLLPVVAVALAACVNEPWPVLKKELSSLHGQSVKVAFDKLGYPSSEGEIAGEKFYIWSMSNAAYVGGDALNLRCTIRIFIDMDVIGHFDVSGNAGACAQYAGKLDPSYDFGL